MRGPVPSAYPLGEPRPLQGPLAQRLHLSSPTQPHHWNVMLKTVDKTKQNRRSNPIGSDVYAFEVDHCHGQRFMTNAPKPKVRNEATGNITFRNSSTSESHCLAPWRATCRIERCMGMVLLTIQYDAPQFNHTAPDSARLPDSPRQSSSCGRRCRDPRKPLAILAAVRCLLLAAFDVGQWLL